MPQDHGPRLFHPEGVSAPHAVALVAAAAALGGLGAAAVADATHKGTHNHYYHGLGDCCDGDPPSLLHPFMDEIQDTWRDTYVAVGCRENNPRGYCHDMEQYDYDSHNHYDPIVFEHERFYFASVRSPNAGFAHQHHVCGDGDCLTASAADYKE